MVNLRDKLIAFGGVFWFITDSLWFTGYNESALFFCAITVISTLLLFCKKDKFFITLALNSWVVLNAAFLISDTFKDNPDVVVICKFVGLIAIFYGAQSILNILVNERNFIEKLRKL
jgi:RsiW-degrading membrane proteinase PrsW (M82 family)